MTDEFSDAVQQVLAEARKIAGISDFERTGLYEPLKTIVYDLLRNEGMTVPAATAEAVSWLRQNVQVQRSINRIATHLRHDLPEG